MSFWVTDPRTGLKSVTLTMFVSGFIVCLGKLLLSGVSIHGVSLGVFGGSDFSLSVGALGAIYAARRHTDATTKDTK